MARKTWVLDTETKGTGARMVPLEDVLEKPAPKAPLISQERKVGEPGSGRKRTPARRPGGGGQKRSTALPPGHVRKKATGELGRVQAVDAKAGTVTVSWLKQGRTSTVPLSSVSRT